MDDQEIELSRVHLTIGLLPYYFESATKAAIVSSVVLNKETGRGTIRFRFHDTVILYADTSLGCCEYVVQYAHSRPLDSPPFTGFYVSPRLSRTVNLIPPS